MDSRQPVLAESTSPRATSLGQRRSLPALLAIIAVIALPNVLSTGLHMTPLLSLMLGESCHAQSIFWPPIRPLSTPAPSTDPATRSKSQ